MKGGGKYKKGRRIERELRMMLECENYYVMRSAGSKGIFDLIAIPTLNLDKKILLIQSKCNKMPPKEELDILNDFKCPLTCEKRLYIYMDRVGFKYILMENNG
jgi:hypothetical protein